MEIIIDFLFTLLLMQRHRGLGEECTTFFQKGAISSLAANSKNNSNELETKPKKGTPANDHGHASALENETDSISSS